MAKYLKKSKNRRILIVDDDEVTRLFLGAALTECGYRSDVAADFESVKRLVSKQPYALVLMDLVFAESSYNGFDIVEYIRSISPDCPVVMMTAYGSTDSAVQALRSNVSDYLQKPVEIDELKFCVERILFKTKPEAEKKPFNGDLAARLGLTEREQDVLQLLYKGCSYTEIGEALSFSTSTAKTYGKRIYKKLDVQSRGEAVYEAVQLNLIRY